MADTNATNYRNILVDLPDFPSGEVKFKLLTNFAASGSEGFPEKDYTLTLSASGTGTQRLPTPDGTGDASWSWRVTTPDANNYGDGGSLTLAYGADLQLTAWLAAAQSSETPSSLEDYFLLLTGGTLTGQLNFSGTDHAGVKLLSLTTVERDALTEAEGMVIYNETDSVVQVYQGGAWVDYGSGGGGGASDVDDLTTDTGNSGEMVRVAAAGGLEYRTPAEVLSDIAAAAASHNHAAADVNSGTFADARIAESNVTQHEAALSITESQISDLGDYATATELATHAADTTTIHGIADTSALLDTADIGTSVQAFDADTAKLDVAQNWSAAQNLQDNELTRPKLKDYGEAINALGDLGGGTDNIDITLGNVVTLTVSTSTQTFTFSNWPASGTAGSVTIIGTNMGSQTINWPAAVQWAGGTEPTLTASGVDILTFVSTDAGTTIYGFPAGLDMS